jgi:putative ABC transport system permease protein
MRLWRRRPTRDDRERDFAREVHTHLELEAEDRRNSGMSSEDASYAAARAFGNTTLIREDIRAFWGRPWLDALVQDVRYALRTMRRAPGFTTIAITSAAVGIGACSAIFAIFNAAVFRPLPIAEPGRLLSISEVDRRTGEAGNVLSYLDFQDLRASRSFADIAAMDSRLPASLGLRGDPERLWGALVTANYFDVVKPEFAVGRGFDASRDDTPAQTPVIVLSHRLWRSRFGGDLSIVGRSISINGRTAAVIGVAAAAFTGTEPGIVSDFWIPFSMLDEVESRLGPVTKNRRRHWLGAVGRLRDGVDLRAARAELDVAAERLNAAFAGGDQSRGFHLERAGRIDPSLRGMASTLFLIFVGATVLVLMTACANIANLLLGRAAARRREIAARMALGAGRGRLVRQLLTESLVLALAGGAGGWAIASYGASLAGLVRTPFGWPIDLSIPLDYRVFGFCVLLSIATGLVFGLLPALRATRIELVTDLKAESPASSTVNRFGLRHALVVSQVAICTVLLLGTGLFLRSLQTTRGMDLGVRNRNLLLLPFDPALDHRSDIDARRVIGEVLEGARAIPGVEQATVTTELPLTFIINNSRFVPAEKASDSRAQRVRTDIYTVGPGFFSTIGVSLLDGDRAAIRSIFEKKSGALDGPAAGQPAFRPVIVNDAFARAAFPNESPIGRRIVGDGKALDIAGVVETAKSRTIGEEPRPSIFLPILTEYVAAQASRGVTLVVKTRGEAASYTDAVRGIVRRVDPSLAVFDVRTMESHLRDALIVPRVTSTLSALAGTVGLALATVGVYGVISFAVARRRRELGIRLAVGARPAEILKMILRQGLAMASVGIGLGLVAALGVGRFAASLLYGVEPTDPLTFVAVPAFLLFVAFAACLLPARAAARVDPVDVLRSE